jgi:Ca2+-binding RTX toxin-like protein
MMESLESRKLLSASLNAEGLLTVEGTAGNDNIIVRRDGTKVFVNINDQPRREFSHEAVRAIRIFGLGGNDRLEERELNRPSTIYGGAGNDTMLGSAGNDVFYGGDGNDMMDGRLGGDQFNGGGGIDTVNYESRTTRIVVSMDGNFNDGTPGEGDRPGERDNVKKDIEVLFGGQGNDTLYGNELANRIGGGGGSDTVWAGAGNDTLIGGPGEDKLYGQDGNDTFLTRGDGFKDSLFGGSGEDRANKDEIDVRESVEVLFT